MHYIFGYGSLIHISNSDSHVGYARLHAGSSSLSIRRAWNAHCVCRDTGRKYTAVGLEWTLPSTARPVNGRIFTCTDDELAALQAREVDYDIIHLPAGLFEFLYMPLPLDTMIATFMPRYPRRPTVEYPINRLYTEYCTDACAAVSAEFAAEFIRETMPVLEQMPPTEQSEQESSPLPTTPVSDP